MKKLILVLLLASGVWAQSPSRQVGPITAASSDCSVAGSCLTVTSQAYNTAKVTIRGTFTGATIVFESSDDGGITWYGTTCTRTDTNIQEQSEALVNSTSRAWDCWVSGMLNFRVRASAIASGTITAGITVTTAGTPPTTGLNSAVDNQVITYPTTSAAAGVTPVTSTTTESNHVLKASAGNLYGVCVTTGGTAGFLMVFNATVAPADGAVTPAEWIQIAANQTACITYASGPPNVYSVGITVVFSSTGPFTKTASATAAFVGRVK